MIGRSKSQMFSYDQLFQAYKKDKFVLVSRISLKGPNYQTLAGFSTELSYHYSGGSRPSDKGGPGHPDPEIRGGGLPFGPHFGLKIRGGGPRPPRSLPGSAPALYYWWAVLCVVNGGYYMAAQRVLKNISLVHCAHSWNIFSTHGEKFCIFKRPCNVLFIYYINTNELPNHFT